MADTISATIQIGITARAATTGTQGWPYAFPTTLVPIITGNANGLMGEKGTIALPPIVMTTGLAQTSLTSIADAGTTPAQSLVTIKDASAFVIGQSVDIYEVGAPANRETSQVMAISGKVLTLKPKLTKTHPAGAVVVATGGARGLAYTADYKLATIKQTIRVTATGTGQVQGFQPHIEARVPIAINIAGSSFPPLVTGYTFIPPIKVTARLRGQQVGAISGTLSGLVDIEANLVGDASKAGGFVDDVQVKISMSATGLGYTLKGTLNQPLPITGTAIGNTPVNGPLNIPVVISAVATGTSTPITSLYGVVSFGFAAYAYGSPSAGTMSVPLPITPLLAGQAVGGANATYGSLNKQIKITGAAVGRQTLVGRMFTPAKLGIIAGRTEVVAGKDTAVFHAAEGRSYLSAGVPVPTDFFFGTISGSGPVARATVTLNGTTGTLTMTVGGAAIMEPLALSTPLTTFTANVAKAINEYKQDGFDFTARANGTALTIFAPSFSGAQLNFESVSFLRTGNATVNNLAPPETVATLDGGRDGSITISSVIEAKQYDDGSNFGQIDNPPIVIVPQIVGSVSGNTGDIVGAIKVNAFLLDGVYGTSISKLNVFAAVSPTQLGIAVPKIVAHPMIIDVPSATHVAKAVAYAVIGPDGSADSDTYQAMFFF